MPENEFGFGAAATTPEPVVGGDAGLKAADEGNANNTVTGKTIYLPRPRSPKVTKTVESLDEFFHEGITQEHAYGLLIGSSGDLANKAGMFLVWTPPKKLNETTLTLVNNAEEIEDHTITRDNDDEFLLNGEETGHDDLLTFIQAFQTQFGFRQMHLQQWEDRPILGQAVPKADKKALKDSKKAFKSFRKSVRLAEKKSRRASKRRGSRRSRSGSETENDEGVIEVEVDAEYDVDADTGGHEGLQERRRSLRKAPPPGRVAPIVDPAEEWVQGSLFGRLQDPKTREDVPYTEPLAPEAGEVQHHQVFTKGAVADAVPVHRWTREQAIAALEERGNRDGDFIVRWSTKVKNGLVVTSVHTEEYTHSSLNYRAGCYMYGSDVAGNTIEEAIDAMCTTLSVTRPNGRPYHLVWYDRNTAQDDDNEAAPPVPPRSTSGKGQRGYQQPVHPKAHILAADGSDDAIDVEHRRIANAPRHAPVIQDRVIRTHMTNQYAGGKNEERVFGQERIPTVNEQARGAPETLGTSHVDHQDAEIQRVKALGGKAARAPQALVDGAMVRDKPADASWASRALKEGQRHNAPEIPGTLQFSESERRGGGILGIPSLVAGLPGHIDEHSDYYFPDLHVKEDAEALLNMTERNGAFLLRPDKDLGNTKYVLSFRNKGKVTHHLLFRQRPGWPFTLCCMPFAPTNEYLYFGATNMCTTLAAVVDHLMEAREYWPDPLLVGVFCPKEKEEYQNMLVTIENYKLNRGDERAVKAQSSLQQYESGKPQTVELVPMSRVSNERRVRKDNAATKSVAAAPKTVKTKKKVMVKKTIKVPRKKPAATSTTAQGPATFNHGRVGAKDAEARVLADNGAKTTGKFLLRFNKEGKLVITVVFKGKATHHTTDRPSDNEPFVINGKMKTDAQTEAELIDHLRTKHKGWPLELTEGVPAPGQGASPASASGTGPTRGELVRLSYNHQHIKKQDAEDLLMANGGAKVPGKFLLRSKTAEGENDYILSVVFKGKATHHAVARSSASDTFTVNKKLATPATNLDDLVEFLRSKHKGWPLGLTEGVVCEATSEYGPSTDGGDVDGSDGADEVEYTEEEVEVEEEIEVEEVVPARGGKKAAAREMQYTVSMQTGPRVTTATTSAVLHGMVGDSEPLIFHGKKKSDAAFAPNQEKDVVFTIPDIGPVSKITLSHNNEPAVPNGCCDWDVVQVVVDRLDANAKPEDRHAVTRFVCNTAVGEANGLEQTFEAESDEEMRQLKAAWAGRMDVASKLAKDASMYTQDTHLARSNVRVPGANMIHDYDERALNMQTQLATAEHTHSYKRDKGISRGAIEKTAIDSGALHLHTATNAQKMVERHFNPVMGASRDAAADARHADKADDDSDTVIAKSKAFADRGEHWQLATA
eukprot:m.23378 g.23378  ORF g.23378 m.23378 type:complete len:1389 (-) comp4075_c0_seq1:34-4200(-)